MGALGHGAEQNTCSFDDTFNYSPSPVPDHPEFLNQQFTLYEALSFLNVNPSRLLSLV
jgi:hypothetical protein